LIDSWRLRHQGITVEITMVGEFAGLAEPVQLTLYRVLQECLTNISRHARASHVDIALLDKPDQLVLSVSDNGQGFQIARHPQRFGLAGIRERVDSIDGQLEIITGEQQGVRVEVVIPRQGEKK
jgi:two-component system sensor histidine kinase UhpB